MRRKKLLQLCESWEQQARNQFIAAEYETTELGRRALNYGAMINYNVAQDLRKAIQPKFRLSFMLRHGA